MSPAANRRGIALPLALFVLIVVAALVAGSFFLGRLEQESGRNTHFAAQAREAAEAAISEAIATLDPAALEATAVGAPPAPLDTLLLAGGVSAASELRRLTSVLFLVRAEGRRHAAGGIVLATRSMAALVELAPGAALRVVERGWFSAY